MTMNHNQNDAPSCGVTFDSHSDNSRHTNYCHSDDWRTITVRASLTIVTYACQKFL